MISNKEPHTELQVLATVFIIAVVAASFAINANDKYGSAVAPINTKTSSWCADSDGGYDIYSKGTISYYVGTDSNLITANAVSGVQSKPDYCQGRTSKILREYYCSGSSMTYKDVSCEIGCGDGKCLKSVADTTKPSVTINNPKGTTHLTGEQIVFSCSGSDNVKLSMVEFWLTGSGGFYVAETRVLNTANTVQTFSKSFSVASTYGWNCKYIDTSGNYAWGYVNGISPGFTVNSAPVCNPPSCAPPADGCTYQNPTYDSNGCQTSCGTLTCGGSGTVQYS
jgi:hypothetical protein